MGRDRHLSSLAATSAFRVQAKIPPPDSPFAFLTLGFFGVVLAIAFFALLAYFVFMALHRRKKEQPTLPPEPEAAVEAAPPPTTKATTETPPVPTSEPESTPEAASTPEPSPAPAEPEAQTLDRPPIPSREHFDRVAQRHGIDRHEISRKRVWLIYRIRSSPEGFRREISDPHALERLDRLVGGLGKRADLHICIEAWETEHEDAVFTGTPGNSAGSQLQQQFGKMNLDWPQSIAEWDRLLELKAE